MMTQLLKKPHKNFLHMKNECSYQILLQIVDSYYNWQSDRLKYQEIQIREMSSWIKTNKESFTSTTRTEQNIDIYIAKYSDMQKHA